MKEKILLVDNEHDIVEFLQYNLEQEGFDVISAFDGSEALEKINENPDLVILDIMMPKIDGFEVYKRIREREEFNHIPIIFLTAKSGEIDEVKGLELGASDYIQKPVSPKKLVARVKSNLRKVELQKENAFPATIKIGPLFIDKGKYIIHINKKETIFPRKEFEILYFFANNPGRVFSRESLLREIWGPDIYVVDRTVDVHIRKIREKLGNYANLIETIKGVGYKFKSD
ncbi:MAG TPA: response regulator transcription factor [Ignavibacteriaceae bacterium]|nr:response regulator transcription factor [Ignavibacteriaceae bacterium]